MLVGDQSKTPEGVRIEKGCMQSLPQMWGWREHMKAKRVEEEEKDAEIYDYS